MINAIFEVSFLFLIVFSVFIYPIKKGKIKVKWLKIFLVLYGCLLIRNISRWGDYPMFKMRAIPVTRRVQLVKDDYIPPLGSIYEKKDTIIIQQLTNNCYVHTRTGTEGWFDLKNISKSSLEYEKMIKLERPQFIIKCGYKSKIVNGYGKLQSFLEKEYNVDTHLKSFDEAYKDYHYYYLPVFVGIFRKELND